MLPFVLDEPFHEKFHRDPKDLSNEVWLIVKDSKVLLLEDTMQLFPAKNVVLKSSLYMGVFQNHHVYAGQTDILPKGAIWVDLKMLYGKIDDYLLALAGRACQLVLWNRTHQYCGACGKKTEDKPSERAKECKACNLLMFPEISPVIMALIQKEDEILLARSPHFPDGMYSVLAGFVSPGESLEECVKREIYEEVGLYVEDLMYFGSQPWPFPSSLMIAFTCKWKAGEIKIDPKEIEDARWFKKDNLPPIPPKISLARFLMDSVFCKEELAKI